MSNVGQDPAGSVTRLAYTPAERAGHQLFGEWVREDGGELHTDQAGNSVGVLAEGDRYLLVGSHVDSVKCAGSYDGVAGVAVGLEIARLFRPAAGCGVRVVTFAAEEGARFGRPNLGSAAAAGLLRPSDLLNLKDADGATLADAARDLSLDINRVEPWIDNRIAAYLEIHIEQGRILEQTGTTIGLVDAIAGNVRLRVTIHGDLAHSGSPMRGRRDALVGAATLVQAVNDVARRGRSTVATVGRLSVSPNSLTTVPDSVTLWVDIRDADGERQLACARSIVETATDVGLELDLDVTVDGLSSAANDSRPASRPRRASSGTSNASTTPAAATQASAASAPKPTNSDATNRPTRTQVSTNRVNSNSTERHPCGRRSVATAALGQATVSVLVTHPVLIVSSVDRISRARKRYLPGPASGVNVAPRRDVEVQGTKTLPPGRARSTS